MENYLLNDFQRELSQTKEYIKHIQQVDNLIDLNISNKPVFEEFRNHIHSFSRDKKMFEYKAIIISLYGLLEKHINLWIKEYLKCFSQLVMYNNLPKEIRKQHFDRTMKLISIVRDKRQAKYNNLKDNDILHNLSDCIKNPQRYNLNLDAFTLQTGNLTHQKVKELFQTIGISQEFTKRYIDDHDLFGKINDLVERRNIIAHGAKTDNLLGLSELDSYIQFLDEYCTIIFDLLKERNIANHTIEKYKEVNCKGVFEKKTVIGIAIDNYTIKVKDWLIIETADKKNKHFYKKQIKSLGKDKVTHYQELEIKEATEVTIKIDNQEELPITMKCNFYIEKK